MFGTLLLVEKKPRILLPISLFLGRLQPFPLTVVISGIYSGRGNLRKFSSFAQLLEKLDETVCWLKVSFGARGAFLLDQAQKNRCVIISFQSGMWISVRVERGESLDWVKIVPSQAIHRPHFLCCVLNIFCCPTLLLHPLLCIPSFHRLLVLPLLLQKSHLLKK